MAGVSKKCNYLIYKDSKDKLFPDLNPAAQGASLTEGKRGKRSKKQNGENGDIRSGSPKSEEENDIIVNAPDQMANDSVSK